MARQSISCIDILLTVVLALMPDTGAQGQLREMQDRAAGTVEISPGIRTDRLSPRKLRTWKEVEAIVFSRDASGRFMHPRLYSLWQWAQTSGHVIYIQFVSPKDRWDNQAGRFKIEKVDPGGQRHVAVIELCLPIINDALVGRGVRSANGFIQYKGLNRRERCAEMLGHELGHAVWTLGDLNRTWMVYRMDQEIAFYSRRRKEEGARAWDEEMRLHLNELESLKETIEAPAIMAEAEVWRELSHK